MAIEKSIRAEEAFRKHKLIEMNENIRRKLLAENAKLLSDMHDSKDYQEILGDPEGEWAGYVGAIELYYSRFQIDSYIRVYKTLTLKFSIPEEVWVMIPITRLMDCVRFIDATNYEDWFASAMVLTSKDWAIKIREARGVVTEETPGHVHDSKLYQICRQCGKKEVVHDTETSA